MGYRASIRRRLKRMRQLRKAHEASGRTITELREEMERLADQGISANAYFKNELWKMSDDEREAFLKKRQVLSEKRESVAREVADKANCSFEEAVEKLKHARKFGVTAQVYLDFMAWGLSDDELQELADVISARKEKRKRNREWMIDVVCEKSGWSRDEAIERMEKARAEGYTYRRFITQALYKLDDDAFRHLQKYEKPKPKVAFDPEKIQEAKKRRLSYEQAIKEEMGWNDAELKLKYLASKTNCGASFAEYYLFGLYKLSPEKQRTYITQEMHIKMQLRYCDYKGAQNLFENKAQFNQHFSEFVHRRWFVNEGLTYEGFLEKISGLSKIIFKPVEGIEGIGIQVYSVNESDAENRRVYDSIVNDVPAVVEEFFVQHEKISEIWPNSVNTIRMMSIADEDGGHVLNAVMKFGTASNVDNYYQGGIAAGVDIETGCLCTDGVNAHGVLFDEHPITKKRFRGFQIPYWDDLRAAVEKAATVIPEMPYIGWDVALSKDGVPEIIEGNHNQGAYLIQYSFAVSNKEGRRPSIDPYLWFEKD